MEFQGPLPADYENVHALNIAFLSLLRDKQNNRRILAGLSDELARRLRELTRREMRWLARTPFLLFSFRERDDSFWRNLLRDDRSEDLFTVSLKPGNDVSRLVAAGLAFVWQLANRNPFAARLLCGASTHWCEQVAEQTLLRLLTVAGRRSDLLVLRARADTGLWNKLIQSGLCEETETRTAALISAMQYILTRQPHELMWQAAACASRDPALRVAEKPKP